MDATGDEALYHGRLVYAFHCSIVVLTLAGHDVERHVVEAQDWRTSMLAAIYDNL